MNLKFWEWFKTKQATDPEADPTALKTLNEYRKAVGIERKPMQRIDRFEGIGNGVAFSDDVKGPSFEDNAEDLKRKLRHSIHQSILTGADTLTLDGVKAIGETITIVGKVDKSKLYDLGYDIKEESAAMVKGLGLEPGEDAGKPVEAAVDTPEEKVLEMEGVRFQHHAGKPSDRPWQMQPNPPCAVNPETGDSEPTELYPEASGTLLVTANIEDETKARIEAFHAKAKDHDPSCEWYIHYMEHIDDRGMEFDCLYNLCKCKGKHGDDQGDPVPVV